MRRVKRIITFVAIFAVVGAGVVIALPWTHDLDNQISIKPQEMPIAPPEFSVPVEGKEFAQPLEIERNYENPVPPTAESIARGEESFRIYCTPCHGPGGEGGGTVVQRGFLAPPNLLSETVIARSDGYIYSYIRHGGIVVMPAYSFALRPDEAWDTVNYVRAIQQQAASNR